MLLPELLEEGAPVMFDRRTWALHDAVMRVAREAGLESLRTYPSRPHAFQVMRAQARWSMAR